MRTPSFLVAGLLAASAGHAAIAPGSSGNGELFLNVYDSTARVSYTLDLGTTMDEFFIAGQPDAGLQRFWVLDDTMWTTFLGLVTPQNLQWAVNALDSTGSPATPGLQRLYTTVRQGDEAIARNMTNQKLSDGIGAAQGGRFFDTINSQALAQRGQSTHTPGADPTLFDIHGSSWSSTNDPGFGYYGKSGGLTPTLNGNAGFVFGNPVGQSAWFYYITRSGSSPGARVLVDEFDNLGHDGYWGLVEVTEALDATSPFVGKYLLSYTIAAATLTPQQRSFTAGIGRTEIDGGFSIRPLDGVAAAGSEAAAGWVTALGPAGATGAGLPALLDPVGAAAVSAVPEPSTALLAALGAGALGLFMTRRRRRD